jgi:hypothetical protein
MTCKHCHQPIRNTAFGWSDKDGRLYCPARWTGGGNAEPPHIPERKI